MDRERELEDLPEHPKGTLCVLVIYGALFVVGWLAIFFLFMARGFPTS